MVGTERFLHEIRITANLQHPHILPLFDSGAADGRLFYVLPYVDGESLPARLNREKQLPAADSNTWAAPRRPGQPEAPAAPAKLEVDITHYSAASTGVLPAPEGASVPDPQGSLTCPDPCPGSDLRVQPGKLG
jgi:hypothetical protein